MLEGLEITEISIDNLERTLRLDAEYYSKYFLAQESYLRSIGSKTLTYYSQISDGNHMSISDSFDTMGVPYYRGGDIYNVFINLTSNPLFIPKHIYDLPTMRRSYLQNGDILMSIVGAIIGNISIVKTNDPATCSCKLAIIRPDFAKIYTEYVALFLMCKYGQFQIQRLRRGSGQTGFILEDFDQLLIPYKENYKKDIIIKYVNDSYIKLIDSRSIYSSVESMLINDLDNNHFSFNCETNNIKSLLDSLAICGRIDAEYYQPKYGIIRNKIVNYINGTDFLDNVCIVKDKNFNPEKSILYKYIELTDIGEFGEIISYSEMFGEDLPSRARRVVHTGDVIISSLDGSLDCCAYIPEEFNGAICSTGFYVLKSEKLNSETLLVLFKSFPMQQLLKQICSGSIMPSISRSDLGTIPMPLIREDMQRDIALLIQQCFTLRNESKTLLNSARDMVEDSISNYNIEYK